MYACVCVCVHAYARVCVHAHARVLTPAQKLLHILGYQKVIITNTTAYCYMAAIL